MIEEVIYRSSDTIVFIDLSTIAVETQLSVLMTWTYISAK